MCNIFSSRDKFHIDISEILLFDDQDFVNGDQLKADLKQINEARESLSETDKLDWEQRYSIEPPVNDNSITYTLWKKYLPDWIPGSLQKSTSTSKEDRNNKTVKDINERVASFQEISVEDIKKYTDTETEFVVVEKWVAPDDQCPCGSGKLFGECCFKKLNTA